MPPGKIAAELLIPAGRFAKAMIEVTDGNDAEVTIFRKIEEEQGERDRVGSAGHADEHTRARRTEPVLPDRPPDLLVKRS